MRAPGTTLSYEKGFVYITWDREPDSCDSLVTLPPVGTGGEPGRDLWERLERVFDYTEALWACTVTVISYTRRCSP